ARAAGERQRRWRNLGRRIRRHLLERARRERGEDAVLDAPERIAHTALRILAAVLRLGRAGGYGERTVNRLDDVGDGNRACASGEPVAAARALVRRQQAAPG